MRLWGSTFGKSLPRVRVAGVLVSALLALLAGGTGQVLAADFYVGGASASDRNPGTASQPFATIQKAADVAAAGDFVNIRSGIYRETIVPANSGVPGQPVTFQPDGNAEVTISGADVVNGDWTVYSGHIYQTAIALPLTGYAEQITGNTTLLANQVFVGGKMMIEARWPNVSNSDDLMNRNDFRLIPKDGWISEAPTTLKDNTIPDIPGGWTGGTIWSMSWFLPGSATITASSAGQINYSRGLARLDLPHAFYYLTGRLGALDVRIEWFYDGEKLYLWAPDGGIPKNVEVKMRNYAFNLTGKSFITIRNVHVFAATIVTDSRSESITLDRLRVQYNSHFVTLPGSDVIYSHHRETGIRLMGPGSAIRNSIIEYSAGNGIVLGGEGCVVENNLIHDISYGGTYCCGIYPAPGNAHNMITHNTIYRTGRACIDLTAIYRESTGNVMANKNIGYNDMYEFGILNTDLGAINAGREPDITGTRIHHNWFHDAANDNAHTFPVGAGIYLDQNTKPATIDHNVFWNNHKNDIRTQQDNSPYNLVYNNTMASGGFDFWYSFETYSSSVPTNSQNNIYRSAVKNHTPQESEIAYLTDPLFVDPSAGGLGFRLQPVSPAIDKGIVIEGITGDYQGNAPDTGAYEFGGTDWVAGCNLTPTGGLIGWWKLDENSGMVASDSSGRANHGRLINGPKWVEGRIGGALHFANTDDTKIYVDIPNSPTLENVQEGDYTIAAWVWPNSLPPGTEVTPAYGIAVKQGRHIGLVYDDEGFFKMQHHSTAGYSLAKSATKSPMAWYHVTGIVSKSNGFVKIYVNGTLESTVNFTPGATAVEFGAETWKLGIAGPDYSKFREAMNGKVDDVRIYNRVLSDDEIAALAGARE